MEGQKYLASFVKVAGPARAWSTREGQRFVLLGERPNDREGFLKKQMPGATYHGTYSIIEAGSFL